MKKNVFNIMLLLSMVLAVLTSYSQTERYVKTNDGIIFTCRFNVAP